MGALGEGSGIGWGQTGWSGVRWACPDREFNLSQSSLTSSPLCLLLNNIQHDDPELAAAITSPHKCPHNPNMVFPEKEFTDTPEDDADISLEDVFEHLDGDVVPEGLTTEPNGGLQLASTLAEGVGAMKTLARLPLFQTPQRNLAEENVSDMHAIWRRRWRFFTFDYYPFLENI
ncbi:uncharacterized protein EI90DRAFT_3134747 [Cantharellus anzutake]|uniref:uncharacterized protein n=1 Tax=Cantharellus anzutake TaxID=1750568 RepID=UPI001904A230|nr:uncharacterized protein EI90DRAFT_3134747 [Cantharellus anzutake]KAF8316195.1 hypothetical protein EI90DRAFT_3134747 [Cantharellus anzutake]